MNMRTVKMLLAIAGLLGAVLAPLPTYSYLLNLTVPMGGGAPQPDRWDFSSFPVVWNINPSHGSNIQGSRSVVDVIQASFNTWISAPNATLRVSRGADSSISSENASPSNVNLICFVCSDADFTKDAQTLAVTITTAADARGEPDGHGGTTRFAGQLIKADIIFNPQTQYTTDGGGSLQDLQTVATHEIGHFFGLAHSAVVRAVMSPAASNLRTLAYDDVAGLSVLYPAASPQVPTGAISGTVRLASAGVFGAHVYAQSVTMALPFASTIRKTPIGILTRPDGSYTIQGLPADSYVVIAEPLDGPVENDDVKGYSQAFGRTAVQTNFTTRWH